jgi:hypothetical protein
MLLEGICRSSSLSLPSDLKRVGVYFDLVETFQFSDGTGNY